jgi:hypothetical protein
MYACIEYVHGYYMYIASYNTNICKKDIHNSAEFGKMFLLKDAGVRFFEFEN